jgi:hypothetical protein
MFPFIATGTKDTSSTIGKFTAGVALGLANISTNFQKVEMTQLLFIGAWGKMIHETWSKKSHDTVPCQ